MPGGSKYSPEFRAMVSQEYIDGKGSVHFLADKYGIGYTTLRGLFSSAKFVVYDRNRLYNIR